MRIEDLPTGAQVNAQGQVALRYYQPAPAMVEAGGKDYFSDVKAAISMTWVDPADVETVLEKRGCG